MNSTTPLSPETESRGGRRNALIAAVALIAVGLSAVAGSRGVHSDWVYRMVELQADPVNGLQSSSGVDVVQHKDQVWIGSSGGVSFTPDRGTSWFTHTDETGLNANNISALLSTGSSPSDTIWAAAVVTEIINEEPIRSGTGLQFSVDGGANWQTPMDLGGIMDSGTVGPFRITFDLAADTQRIFAANWAGGLIGSEDGGVSWKRFHATSEDADWWQNFDGAPPLSGLYFSVLADTGHTDTVVIWAGSACGIVRWDFVAPHIKPSATRILDYAYSSGDSLVFLAGETGLSSAEIWRIDTTITIDDTTSPPTVFYDTTIDTAAFYHNWKSLYAADGLLGEVVTQVHFFGGKLFTVLSDSVGGSTQRFLTLAPDLNPLSIQEIFGGAIDSLFTVNGANVFDFENFGDRYLYLAGGPAGLFVSVDSGFTWSAVTVDPNTAAGNGRNTVYTLDSDSLGALWCGTDSGIVKLYIDRLDQSGALVDSFYNFTIRDAPPVAGVGGSGGSVRDVELQEYRDTLTNAVDSVFLWTANQPTSDSGVYISFRIRADVSFLTVDTFLFASQDPGARVRDLSIKGETILFAGNFGLRSVVQADPNFGGGYTVSNVDGMIDRRRDPALGLVIDTAETIFQADGATHVGARSFFGVNRSENITREGWGIAFGNIFDFTPDSLAVYRTNNSNLSGNFIPAMGVQYRSGMAPVIWAACRPGSPNTTDGACFDVRGLRQVSYLDLNSPNPDWVDVPSLTGEVWNFAFDGDTIYAASTEGLYWSPNAQTDFVRDSLKSARPLDIVINDSASVNGVAVIDTNLWVTTEDGFAVRGLNETVYEIFKVRDTGGGGTQVVDEVVYAYPVPYDYNNDNPVQFRYQVPFDANTVTIEIYDFAMNLVSRVVDNEARTPGVIYDTRPSDAWSGQNDENQFVAPGIYYFKISFSNNEMRWGKLAVIPGR